jgi:hypothetical protein
MLSRRNFIRNVALGATGAAFSLGRMPHVEAAGKEVGVVTLDAIFMVYIPAIPGSVAGSTNSKFSFGKNFAVTFKLGLPQNPDLVLRASVPAGQEELFATGVSQFTSLAVPGAMFLRTDFGRRVGGTKSDLSIGAGPDTGLYGLFRPRLRLAGRPGKLSYRIVDTVGAGTGDLSELETVEGFSKQTADSLRALYVTDPALLVAPRFGLGEILSSGLGTVLNEEGSIDSGVSATASAIATVIDQTGFQSEPLVQSFAPGSPVQITYTSVQELPSKSIATFTLAPAETTMAVKIYQDFALKTWVIVPFT